MVWVGFGSHPGNGQTRKSEETEMSVTLNNLTNTSSKTEIAAWVMGFIDGSKTKWVKTSPMLAVSGIRNDSGNVGRRLLLSVLHAMHEHGLLEKNGDGSFAWAISDHCLEHGWNTTNPFATVAPKPVSKGKFPFGPGRLKLTGETFDHKEELKLQCGAKWDEDLKCWHIADEPSEKVRLQRLDCYKAGRVKIDWEASGYSTVTEESVVNRVAPAEVPHANGNGKAHTPVEGMSAALSAELRRLELDIKREEDRSAKLAIAVRDAETCIRTLTEVAAASAKRLDAAEKALAAQPKTIKVEKYDGTVKTLKGVILPANFDRILTLAKCRENILLVGPAGCGKSTVAKLVAQTLGLEFSKMGGCEGLTQSHLLGKDRPLANKGEGRYEVSDFVVRYEKGGVACLDEMDAFDPNVFLTLNQALDDGDYLPLPNRPGKPAKKHKDFVCIGTANTMGRGGNRMYVRNQLDASSLDRFGIGIVECGYDENLETAICPNAEVREALWKIRTRVEEAGLRRIVSTRFLAKAHKMTTTGGWTLKEVKEALFSGWSKDEIAKVS